MNMVKIKIHGKLKEALGDRGDLFIVGSVVDGGPIATKEQYEDFLPSTAMLNKRGIVMRFGKAIGEAKDIEEVKAGA